MPKEQKQPKRFKLNPAESKNIKFRRMVLDYLNDAVHEELGTYLQREVLPRLNLKDEKIEISQDGEWISIIKDPPKIVT